jgi:hypothetical protein
VWRINRERERERETERERERKKERDIQKEKECIETVRFVCDKEIEKREKDRRQSKCPSKIKKKQKHFWSFSFLR